MEGQRAVANSFRRRPHQTLAMGSEWVWGFVPVGHAVGSEISALRSGLGPLFWAWGLADGRFGLGAWGLWDWGLGFGPGVWGEGNRVVLSVEKSTAPTLPLNNFHCNGHPQKAERSKRLPGAKHDGAQAAGGPSGHDIGGKEGKGKEGGGERAGGGEGAVVLVLG